MHSGSPSSSTNCAEAPTATHVRILFQVFDLTLQTLRQADVVAIHAGDVFAAARRPAPSFSAPTMPVFGRLMMRMRSSWRAIFLQHGKRIVRRAVVDNDELKIFPSLAENAFNCLGQVRAAVVNRHDDGNGRIRLHDAQTVSSSEAIRL